MSLRSCEQLNLLFSAMVNDSNIVKSFQLGNNNCGYYLNYGVAPFFESEITKVLNESPCYSVSVDESLSKIFQLEQMDLNVKFRDDELGVAKVIIILPFFFGMWNAGNIENEIYAALKPVSEEKLIQLSMGGSNSNGKVFDLLKRHREEAERSPFLNLGSSLLHIVHGAFQTRNKATDSEIIKAMWKILDNSLAQRELFVRAGEANFFPMT